MKNVEAEVRKKGVATTATAAAIRPPVTRACQRGWPATSGGRARTGSAVSHDDCSAVVVRRNPSRRHSRATTMTPSSTMSVRPLRPVQKNTSWSATPMARPAPKAAPTESMPVMVAPASPRMRSGSPTASVEEKPMIGASKMAPPADSNPARTHASVDTRRTGIPRSRALGAFSAAARRAMPYADQRRKANRARARIGPATSTIRCCGSRTIRPKTTGRKWTGTGKRLAPPARMRWPLAVPGFGSTSRATMTIWATPMVAMSTMSRGLRKRRRRMPRSMTAPNAPAEAMLRARAGQ